MEGHASGETKCNTTLSFPNALIAGGCRIMDQIVNDVTNLMSYVTLLVKDLPIFVYYDSCLQVVMETWYYMLSHLLKRDL